MNLRFVVEESVRRISLPGSGKTDFRPCLARLIRETLAGVLE